MLININDKSRMPIKYLWQLIFTFVFDKKSCGHMTKQIIGEQIVKWHEFVDINKKRELEKYGLDPDAPMVSVGLKGTAIDEMEYQVRDMARWVVREECGELEPEVQLFKKHKIDFHMVEPMCHVFPEYVRAHRNTAKGQEALKRAMKDHPEDYINPNIKKRQFFTPN